LKTADFCDVDLFHFHVARHCY